MDDYQNPKAGKTYISKRLPAFGNSGRNVRIASKVIESPDSYAFVQVKDEVIIRHKPDAKSYIAAKFFEDTRGIFVLNIQGYSVATNKPHNASFAFVGEEIGKLAEFIDHIQSMKLDKPSQVNIDDEELRQIALSEKQAHTLFAKIWNCSPK